MNQLEPSIGGLREALHILERARLQDPPRQKAAARESIKKIEEAIPGLEEVLVLLRAVAASDDG